MIVWWGTTVGMNEACDDGFHKSSKKG